LLSSIRGQPTNGASRKDVSASTAGKFSQSVMSSPSRRISNYSAHILVCATVASPNRLDLLFIRPADFAFLPMMMFELAPNKRTRTNNGDRLRLMMVVPPLHISRNMIAPIGLADRSIFQNGRSDFSKTKRVSDMEGE